MNNVSPFLKPVAESVFFLLFVLFLAKPIGLYLCSALAGVPSKLTGLFRPLDRWSGRLAGPALRSEQDWRQYATSLVVFNTFGIGVLLAIELLQKWLPLNPQRFPSVPLDVAVNTAVSFATNTNWQSYVPEKTMSYLPHRAG